MKKILRILTVCSLSTISAANIIACSEKQNNDITVPNWVKNMIKSSKNQSTVGYDHYYLINKNHNPTDQNDWVDTSSNQSLYLYLPDCDTVDQAIKNISLIDSAYPMVNIKEKITWIKNGNAYYNNNFITEDTTVGGYALMSQGKHHEILTSNIINAWNSDQKIMFEKWGSMVLSYVNPNSKDQNWWNANGWEKLLNPTQLQIYNLWIKQKQIGMNVPLSLVDFNVFKLAATNINHVYSFTVNSREAWINNNGNLISYNLPHWGFYLQIFHNQQLIFSTPQLVSLNNTFGKENIDRYLLNQVKYYSFNSEENLKFKRNYINDND